MFGSLSEDMLIKDESAKFEIHRNIHENKIHQKQIKHDCTLIYFSLQMFCLTHALYPPPPINCMKTCDTF